MEKRRGCTLVKNIGSFSFDLIFPDQTPLLQLDGSLTILAENVVGSTKTNHIGEPILQYGRRYCCGKFSCTMEMIIIDLSLTI